MVALWKETGSGFGALGIDGWWLGLMTSAVFVAALGGVRVLLLWLLGNGRAVAGEWTEGVLEVTDASSWALGGQRNLGTDGRC